MITSWLDKLTQFHISLQTHRQYLDQALRSKSSKHHLLYLLVEASSFHSSVHINNGIDSHEDKYIEHDKEQPVYFTNDQMLEKTLLLKHYLQCSY